MEGRDAGFVPGGNHLRSGGGDRRAESGNFRRDLQRDDEICLFGQRRRGNIQDVFDRWSSGQRRISDRILSAIAPLQRSRRHELGRYTHTADDPRS